MKKDFTEHGTKLECFSCHKVFTQKEIKQKPVPPNFHAMGTASESTGTVDQCPHCGAVAFFGFTVIKGEDNA